MNPGRWLSGELVHVTDQVEAELERSWSLAKMARVAGYSPFHFQRAFRAAIGETPTAFVERLRLERAALLLLAGEAPITHLAWDVGFRNPETFARRFRKRFGVAARRYRRNQLELWSRLGLEAGKDPLAGPGAIRVERLPPLKVWIRRHIGEDEAFFLEPGEIGMTLDWPGITEPGRVRQDSGRIRPIDAAVSGEDAVSRGGVAGGIDADFGGDRRTGGDGATSGVPRVVGGGEYATLVAPAGEPVPATVYQRLFVWATAGRHRLRAGAILEIRRGENLFVHLPVRDTEEG